MKNNIKSRISETFELPKETILDVPNIRITGDNEVFIENHKGIVEYTNETLRMASSIGIIKISGFDLHIKEINEEDIIVNGIIDFVEFIR